MTQLSQPEAIEIESAELAAWRDMYRAIPESFRQKYEPELVEIGDIVLTRSRGIPFVHFNAALSLGLYSPATEADVEAVVAAYRAAGIPQFVVLHHPFCQPVALVDWLSSRGCVARPGWDRVYRFGPASSSPPVEARGDIAFVTTETASTWAQFLDGWYGLPTAPWLAALVGRPGWRHAMLIRDGRPVAVRSMFVKDKESAWFGVEAPIPGLMAPSFEDDHALLHALIAEAEREGVRVFSGDVEATNEARSGRPYERWLALGFSVAYHRTHYVHHD